MKPQRIQRKRTKGWKMPLNTVYVGRPSMYGNYCDSLKEYEDEQKLLSKIFKNDPSPYLWQLKGKNLACWCPLNQPCHADILLEIANK